jgi:hypothetical protein
VLQVAVFDDAVAGPAALIGVAAVPLASLAEGIPVEGVYSITSPVDAQPAGSIQISVAWHNPMTTGNKQLQGRLPLLHAAAGTTTAVVAAAEASSMQQQLLQHQHEVALQKAVPLLSSVGAPNMPGISSGAVAAIHGALDWGQQQQVPLLHSAGRNDGSSAAAIVESSIRPAVPGKGMMLLQRPQLSSHMVAACNRYSSASPSEHLQQDGRAPCQPGMLQPLSAANAAHGRVGSSSAHGSDTYDAVTTVAAESTATAIGSINWDHAPVMRQVPPATELWGSLDSTIYFKLEALQLTDDALQDPGLQHVLLTHMFCEDFTSAADQCTLTVAKR